MGRDAAVCLGGVRSTASTTVDPRELKPLLTSLPLRLLGSTTVDLEAIEALARNADANIDEVASLKLSPDKERFERGPFSSAGPLRI